MNKLLKYVPLATIVLGALALVMIFLPSASISMLGVTKNFSGLDLTFGREENGFAFSFMNFLTYLFVIGAIVLSVLNMKEEKPLYTYIIGGLFILAGIFFFCTISFSAIAGATGDLADAAKKLLDLGVGAILSAIFSLLAGIATLGVFFLKKFGIIKE